MEKEEIPFQGFNEYGEVRIYEHGILPHWRQEGCAYFVTFRLADSLPAQVVRELREQRHAWLRMRGINPEAKEWKREFARLGDEEQRDYERQTTDRLNRRLDEGYGSCVLRRAEVREIVAEGLDYFHGERTWTGDFVVMPNHVHVLMTPIPPFELEQVLGSIKGFSSKQINMELGRQGAFWQRESYDHIVRDAEQLEAFQRYIQNNPVKAKLSAGEYRYASAEYGVEL